MQNLASGDVTDSYAGLTVKMLNPDGRQTMGMADLVYLAWSHLLSPTRAASTAISASQSCTPHPRRHNQDTA